MNSKSRTNALLFLAFSLLVGCKRNTASDTINFKHNKDGKGTPVATWDDDSVSTEELKQKFAEMSPFIRARYQTLEQRKEYVDGLARFELLAAEARRRGLQNEPEVVDAAKKTMVQKLIQKEFDEKKTPVSDAEISDYYEKHKSDYVKPETTRLSDIFFAASKEDSQRPKKKQLAEEVLTKAKANKPTDSAAFIALVRQYSEDPKTKPLDGDMRFLTEPDLTAQYGPEVAAASAGLKQLGDLSPVVETAQGFYILRFQGRQAAISHGLEQVKTQIESRIRFDRRQQNFNKFVETLKADAKYKLDEAALAKVEIDTSPPGAGKGAATTMPPSAGPPTPPAASPRPAPGSPETGQSAGSPAVKPPAQAKSPAGH
jgi:peptidyl-prolyl cis-trans isomerase C